MSTDDKLPLDLTWQADGHVTEVALSMMADGEEALLSEGAEAHVGKCDACSARLGAAALMSLRVTEELPAIAAHHATAHARAEVAMAVEARAPEGLSMVAPALQPIARPVPVRAIAAALIVAVIGAIPPLIDGLPKLQDFILSVVKMLPVFGRSVMALIQGTASRQGGVAPSLTWLAAVLFLIAGLSLARTMSRRHSLQGGVG